MRVALVSAFAALMLSLAGPCAAQMLVPLRDAPFSQLVNNQRTQAWTTPIAAWLVWDPDWRGRVSSSADMIGANATAGFDALSALDRNGDGELTGAELDGLALWCDENGDGVSQPGEVLPVSVHGIEAISTHGVRLRAGLSAASAGVRFDDGHTRTLYDWARGGRARAS